MCGGGAAWGGAHMAGGGTGTGGIGGGRTRRLDIGGLLHMREERADAPTVTAARARSPGIAAVADDCCKKAAELSTLSSDEWCRFDA
ncbi:hypothetical protein GCM10010532_102570 [Dactylosporangium siamense]|uniref:Uncharacterized protein n=1 Tax=Dactylosporangium siamense TaxID=685454 RepID=A0A919UBP2_9ACTN|nr:hypothetical protein Dsi01nite_038910 [Dactylosporangium siamense]